MPPSSVQRYHKKDNSHQRQGYNKAFRHLRFRDWSDLNTLVTSRGVHPSEPVKPSPCFGEIKFSVMRFQKNCSTFSAKISDEFLSLTAISEFFASDCKLPLFFPFSPLPLKLTKTFHSPY